MALDKCVYYYYNIILIPQLSLSKIYAAQVSHAHRPPLHGSAVAARAAPGTYRQTDGQTQRYGTSPPLNL